MKLRPVLFVLLFAAAFSHSFAQSQGGWGDGEAAGQYVQWAEQAITEGRWAEALAALERAADFAGVSSDVSYLLALARSHERKSRGGILQALDSAVEINRWVNYNAAQALLLKAEHLIGMHNYTEALAVLDQTGESAAFGAADSAMLRLLALRGLAADSAQPSAAARFCSLAAAAMDRYPRDPRPLRIFFEYAHNKKPASSRLTESDLALAELALRRLPFLLDADPDLAWMAAPFMRDTEAARRAAAAYRAQAPRPSPGSIAAALNLGLLDDRDAVEELFGGFAANEERILDKDIVVEIDGLLRSEEGRDFFTQKLLSFDGVISFNRDSCGYTESLVFYRSGVIREAVFDKNRAGVVDLRILFGTDGVPVSAEQLIIGGGPAALVQWERYPSVQQVTLAHEVFLFRPADFQFAPVGFIELGGSKNHAGLEYPAAGNTALTRRSLVSFCTSLRRPSVEFPGAEEQIFLERGIPRQAVETLDGKQVSVTEFERGAPVIQYLDFDLDGRMETIRRFRPPDQLQPGGQEDYEVTFDYRHLTASSESDWTGGGNYKTGEVYLPDGSVVYSWDLDGGGTMNYSETKTGNEK